MKVQFIWNIALVSWKFPDISEILTASIIRAINRPLALEKVNSDIGAGPIRQKFVWRQERTSKALVNFYKTTRSNNPEHNYLQTCRHENLKSHKRNTRSPFSVRNTEIIRRSV
jgi:hypothetical protein